MSRVKCVLVISEDNNFIGDVKQALEVCLPWTSVKTTGPNRDIRKLIRCHQPQAVVLDLGASDNNGFDVLTDIRQVPEIPIFTLSYTNDESIVVNALEMGADGHMTKPIRPFEFIARLKALIARKNRLMKHEKHAAGVF